jgi:hypothetical protein
MKSKAVFALTFLLVLFFAVTAISAEKQLVSGDLKRLNNFVKIVVNPANGNALVVWAQGNANNNDYGRIYASELTRQQDGSYVVGSYFMVSPNSGSHNRPSVAWLPNAGKYIIAWDTSFYDLNELKKLEKLLQRPFPGAEILARTYTPGSGGEAGLGEMLTVNDSAIELNVVANVIPIELQTATVPYVATDTDRVFISYLGSDESEHDNYPAFEAGLWGSKWDVSAGSQESASPGVTDISLVSRAQMLFWADQPINISVIVQGFEHNGKLYCAGAYMTLGMEYLYTAVGMIMQINSATMALENYFETKEYDPKGKDGPINAFGQVVPLDGVVTAPSDVFTLIGASNVYYSLRSINSELAPSSEKDLGLVSKPGDILDQRLFKTGAMADAPAKKSDVSVLYYNKLGQFRYRSLAAGTGKPTGISTTLLKIKKRRLKYMDVATYGKDVLVAFAEQSNKKNYKINFFKFSVQ